MTTKMAETKALVSTLQSVNKRDGSCVAFDPAKVRSAIARAGAATGEFGDEDAGPLTEQVVKVLVRRTGAGVLTIEKIQDVVEHVLISADHFKTARAYIVYREQHRKLRRDFKTVVDVESSINEYVNRLDWRINANANQGYSLGGLVLNVAGKVVANYWLNHVYSPEMGRRIAAATFIYTIWTCWRATARAGR